MAQSPAGQDWTVQAVDRVESVVTTIRDKTVVPVTTVARAMVYGIVVGVLSVMALALIAIGAVRALNLYLPLHVGVSHARSVWVSYGIVGGIFVLVGLLFMRKANARVKR